MSSGNTSERSSSDFSVISVWAYNASGDWLWVDGICKKQLMDKDINDLFRLAQIYNPQQVGIEVSGQQGGSMRSHRIELGTLLLLGAVATLVLGTQGGSENPALLPATSDNVSHVVKLCDLHGHSGMVTSAVFLGDTGLLASAGTDGTVRLWNLETAQEVHSYQSQVGDWNNVFFFVDGLLASSIDESIRLWRVDPWEDVTPEGLAEERSVLSLATAANENLLAVGRLDHKLEIWNLVTGEMLRSLPERRFPVWGLSLSPDGALLASAVGGDTPENSIRLWDVETGELLNSLAGHERYVYSTSFSPDGTLLASASGDSTVKIWYIETGEEVHTLVGHHGKVMDVEFSPDGMLLVSASAHGRDAILWDVQTGSRLRYIPCRGELTCVAFSPDGTLFAIGGDSGTLMVWGIRE